jgi:signal peptidase I
VERGDVVVFKYPEDPRRDFIKRCVAVGGDTVEMRAKQLFVNGEPVDEPYVVHKDPRIYPDLPGVGSGPRNLRNRDNFGPYTVPEDHIFCLGDNRDNSSDSRFWGPVPLSYVKGRAVIIYWSYESQPHDWEWRGVWHRIRQLGEVVLNFFTKTRWERQFKLVR